MIIAIPAQGSLATPEVSEVLGRCAFFVIVDTHTGQRSRLPNPGKDAEGGAGIDAANTVVNQHVDVVSSREVGAKARKVFDRAGVRIHYHTEDTIDAVVAAVQFARET